VAQPETAHRLFWKAKGTISEHIKHIFEDGELEADSVFGNSEQLPQTARDYDMDHYNLDMVLALGFRVRSQVGVRFRQWATTNSRNSLSRGSSWTTNA